MRIWQGVADKDRVFKIHISCVQCVFSMTPYSYDFDLTDDWFICLTFLVVHVWCYSFMSHMCELEYSEQPKPLDLAVHPFFWFDLY